MPLPLSEDDYGLILNQATPDDLEALNLTDEELTYLHTRSKARDHGSGLAKHRWEHAYAAKQNLEAGQATDTFPTPEGNIPYGGKANPLGSFTRPVNPGGMTHATDEIPTPIPDLPTLQPVGKDEGMNPNERGLVNLGIGAANAIPGGVNFFTNVLKNPVRTTKELVEITKTVGKAGVWGMASGIPGAQQFLESQGIGPDQFEEMFLTDPVSTSMMILGGVEGVRRGVSRAKPPDPVTPGAPQPPLPVESPAYQPTAFEAAHEALRTQLAEGGATGRMGVKNVGEGGKVNPKDRAYSAVSSPKGSGTHSIQAAQAEYQLVRPDLTKKEIKAAWAKDSDAVLREIAYARAKDAISNSAQSFGSENIPGSLASQTAEGVGVDPTVPINRPLDAFDNSRLQEMRNARKTVEEFHQNRVPSPNKPSPAVQQVIDTNPPAISTGLGALPESAEILPPGGVLGDLIRGVADQQKADITSVSQVATHLKNLFTDFSERPFVKTAFGTLPQFFKMADKIPDLYAAFAAKLAAADDAAVAHRGIVGEGLDKIISPKEIDYGRLGAYFIDQRRQALLANPNTAPGVQLPALGPLQAARIASNPRLQSALKHYDARMAPELDVWKKDAGIEVDTTTPDNRYLPLKTVAAGRTPPPGTWVIDQQGNLFQWTKAHTQSLGKVKGFGPFRKQTAQAARAATGQGQMWIADPGYLFDLSLKDRIPKARHNQLINVVKNYQVSEADAKAGSTSFQGKDTPIKWVDVQPQRIIMEDGEITATIPSSIPVPAPVAEAYNFALNPPGEWNIPGLAALNSFATSLQLAAPAEAAIHSVNVITALYRQPGIGGKNGPLGRLIANDPTSVGRWASIMADVVDQSGPLLERDIRRLSTHGGVRASQFAGEEGGLQRLPGLKQLKKVVFDYPGHARGVKGLETRVRVAALRLLDHLDPAMSDAKKTAIINNEYGTYLKALQPTMVRALRQVPIFGDPFAAAGVALTKGGFKALAGKSGAPYKAAYAAEVATATIVPAVLVPILLNKLINGAYPWDQDKLPGLKPGDVRIFADDKKTVDIPFRLLAPAASRGLGVFGGKDIIADIMKGNASPDRIAQDALRGAMNTAAHRVGPLGRVVSLATTGKAPHFTPSMDLLQVAELSPQHQAAENIKIAGTEGLPVGEQFTAFEEGKPQLKNPAARVVQRILLSFGLGANIGPSEDTLRSIGEAEEFARFKKAAQSLGGRVAALPKEDQDAAIKLWVDANVPPKIRSYALRIAKKTVAYRNLNRPATN